MTPHLVLRSSAAGHYALLLVPDGTSCSLQSKELLPAHGVGSFFSSTQSSRRLNTKRAFEQQIEKHNCSHCCTVCSVATSAAAISSLSEKAWACHANGGGSGGTGWFGYPRLNDSIDGQTQQRLLRRD